MRTSFTCGTCGYWLFLKVATLNTHDEKEFTHLYVCFKCKAKYYYDNGWCETKD